MILAAALLTAIGVSDLARPSAGFPAKQQKLRSLVLAATAGVTLSWGLGVAPWICLAGVALVVGWLLATPRRHTGTWAVAVLAVVLVLLVFIDSAALTPAAGPFRTWFASPPSVLSGLSLEQFAVGIASFAFVLNSCNIVVRVVIDRTDIEPSSVPPPAGEGDEGHAENRPLKGGRYLGPIERTLILALGLAGQFAAIGAVVGAKSIIRFPEISGSRDRASTAEYFLIGSGLSWGLALLLLVATQLTP